MVGYDFLKRAYPTIYSIYGSDKKNLNPQQIFNALTSKRVKQFRILKIALQLEHK